MLILLSCWSMKKTATNIKLPQMQLCAAPPWLGDPVIVVDATHAARSHIVSPQVLPFTLRTNFSTLIRDVATTGNSGSGVFDQSRKCLLGIMSRKVTSHTTEGDKDIAKYSYRQRQLSRLYAGRIQTLKAICVLNLGAKMPTSRRCSANEPAARLSLRRKSLKMNPDLGRGLCIPPASS